MRLRLYSLIFVISLGLATIILLYQVLSLPYDGNVNVHKKENLAYLESRIKRLEEDIHSNHDTIKEIRSLIKGLSSAEKGLQVLLESPIEGKKSLSNAPLHKFDRSSLTSSYSKTNVLQPLFNFSKAVVQMDDCVFCQSAPSSVDIQMKNVLDILPFDNPDGGAWKQGWKVEYDASRFTPTNKLKVFVVPHSHNDPGWIKTFEKYFDEQTKHILDNMVIKLSEDHRRKFIWAEISFFSLWWDRQSMEIKDAVKKLVESGQLEIVTGGWVMPDEASTHYYSMLDQLLTGHEWLQLNLDTKPKSGWSIDPFGMSPTMAYILKRSGLKNMLIQRTHYSVKKHLAKEKSLEFRWRQIWDDQSSTDILCHMMPFYSYDIPHTCGPDPKICCQFDFRRLAGSGVTCPWRIPPQQINEMNVDAKSKLLLEQYRKKAELFKTNILLVPLGDDFRYDKAAEWDNQFTNYQKLFDYMNKEKSFNVEAQFGTLSDYFTALREAAGKGLENAEEFFPTLSGDFFAYADRDEHYWTGYYTSRPFYKRMDRVLQFYLRSAELLFSLMLETETHSGWSRKQQEIVYSLMDNLAQSRERHNLFQHHDGITGTSRDNVVVDYANKLLTSIKTCQHIIQQAIHSLLSQNEIGENSDEGSTYFELGERFTEYSTQPEKTVLQISIQSPLITYIFNPDSHKRQHIVTVRVDTPYVEVMDRSGEVIMCQVDPIFTSDGDAVPNEFDVHFIVSLDALSITGYTLSAVKPSDIKSGFTTFSQVQFRHSKSVNLPEIFSSVVVEKEEPVYLRAGHVAANFSSEGLLQSFSSHGHKIDSNLSFIKYDAGTGGAYLFLPRVPSYEIRVTDKPVMTLEGPLRSTLTLHLYNIKHQVILQNSPGVDGLGLQIKNYIDVRSERNVEFGMKFSTNIESGNFFYTDLNGFQIIKRTRYDKLPLQGNFYPVATQMFIEDQDKRLTVITASPLGGSSVKSGEMEIILDRQLNQDDERGLGQGVHDNVMTVNTVTLLLEPRLQSKESTLKENIPAGYASLTSHFSSKLLLHPSITMHALTKNNKYAKHWNVGGELPCDVEMVNLRSLIATKQPGAPRPPSSTIALTLHRLGFSCSFPSIGLSCSTNNGKIRISDLFPATFSEEVKQMSLSHLYQGVDMGKSYSLTLHPMEMYSFKLFISSVN